ncbi:hypothetical protein Sjap_012578 [Stephania japonica]|uniref:VQ domain-containing protein n=1 Tax=Stephania japonica TaxID=461633 RepID=A0AAP0IWA9_9MAGN
MDSFVTQKRELQGPRPPPLKLCKESFKINKKHKNNNNPPHHEPVVIHIKSPEIIHVRPQDFMNMVQQLTGKPAAATLASSADVVASTMTSYRPLCGSPSVSALMLVERGHKDQSCDAKEVKEDHANIVGTGGVSSSISPNLLSMAAPLSLSTPLFSNGLFTPSPRAFINLLEFGPIF